MSKKPTKFEEDLLSDSNVIDKKLFFIIAAIVVAMLIFSKYFVNHV